MASHPDTKIDCSKVYVKKSSFSNEQTGEFDGAFAAVDIKKGAFLISQEGLRPTTVAGLWMPPGSVSHICTTIIIITIFSQENLWKRVSCDVSRMDLMATLALTSLLGQPNAPTRRGVWDQGARPFTIPTRKEKPTQKWIVTLMKIVLKFMPLATLPRMKN